MIYLSPRPLRKHLRNKISKVLTLNLVLTSEFYKDFQHFQTNTQYYMRQFYHDPMPFICCGAVATKA